MSLSPAYQELHKEIVQLHYAVRDAVDDFQVAAAFSIQHELTALEDDIETAKNPRDLDSRITRIQNILKADRGMTQGWMSSADADHFYRVFEDIRLGLRKLPNY